MVDSFRATLANTSVADIFCAAASTDPTPGGGCISAIGGYFGISLLLKAIRISARKQPSRPVYELAERELLDLASLLLEYAQADSDSFGVYIAALRLPRASDAESLARRDALRDASLGATSVALDILDAGNAVLHCATRIQNIVLPTILADVKAGVAFTRAMNVVAIENAQANLSGLSQYTDANPLRDRLKESLCQHDALLQACTDSR